jgi:hypothetical protein
MKEGRKEGRKEARKEGRKEEGRKNKDPAPCRSSNRFVCGIIQVLSFGTFVNGNAMASGVGHTVRSNGFGRAI